MRIAFVLVVMLAACGDNGGGGDDVMPDGPCEPPEAALPTTGLYIDPHAVQLAGCVEDGLRKLPGRWFVAEPMQYFRFEYPKYEGSCTTGFHRLGNDPDDHD